MKKVFLGSEITFYIAAIAFFIYTNAINAQISNSSSVTKDLADSVNEFALKLYSRTTNKTQNYFISPYSVWIAMSMCYAGSAGITKTELKRLLSYRKNNDTETFKEVEQYLNNFVEVRNASYSLNIANRIFSKKDDSLINPSYLNLIKTYFKTDAQELNFTNNFDAVRTINNWVSNKTANRIKDLLTPDLITKYTKLVLVNAIYFKGLWLDRFNRSDTTKTPFYLANGTKTNVDMMVIKKKRFRCLTELDDLDASLCELPYEGEKIAMTIILPNKNSSLSKLEQKLDIKKLRNVLNKEKYLDYVNIHLPKFKLEYKSEMSDDLKKLGAESVFSDSADLSGISSNTRLKISKVVHQTFLDVTEGGTEAAAATAVIITRMTIWDPIEFVCDRPFMFMIHDTISKAILFLGKFHSP